MDAKEGTIVAVVARDTGMSTHRAEVLQVQSRGSCGQLSYSKRFRGGTAPMRTVSRSGRVERYSTEVYYSSITLYYLSQHR